MTKEILERFYLNYRLYIFPAVIAVSSLILIMAVIYPQTAKLISNRQVEEDLKTKAEFLQVKAQTLENYDQVDLSRKVDSVLNAYPTERDFGSVLGLLQGLTAGSGFNVISLAFGQGGGKESGGSQSYNVKLEILGPKFTLTNLINNIENSTRIIKVNSMEISATRSIDVISVLLGIEVLYSALPQTFGTIDSPLPTLSSQEEEILGKLASSPRLTPTSVLLSPRGKANPFE